jgi:hypothetical protein
MIKTLTVAAAIVSVAVAHMLTAIWRYRPRAAMG